MSAFDSVRVVVVGAGFAGAATAAALARGGAGPGVILEREPLPGAHASGKNAAIVRLPEFDPIVRTLVIESLRHIPDYEVGPGPLVKRIGGIYLGHHGDRERFETCGNALSAARFPVEILDETAARDRFRVLESAKFELALYSANDGVIDIHALLLAYLEQARRGRFTLLTRTEAQEVRVEAGRVTGVVTSRGTIKTDVVIDASGAWAGRLGRGQPLPYRALRRHLFVSDELPEASRAPIVWDLHVGYYFRPEGTGLLLSPCDETAQDPGVPVADPAAADLLASKLTSAIPALADLGLRSSWACLRTFAADRRPVIGPDPDVDGLFHVSALGGFGAGASWALGEVAADFVLGVPVTLVDPAAVQPSRIAISTR